MASDPPPPFREERAEAETRDVIERAERAWQRQVEREESSYAGPGPMTRFRWVLVAVALAALILIVVKELLRI